jgi:cobalamin biosynthesis protein CbiD
MNKLNDIFKMISQMEKNAEEVKLGTHQVELALLDDLKKLAQDMIASRSKVGDERLIIIGAQNKMNKALINSEDVVKKVEKSLFTNYLQEVKNLGIDIVPAIAKNIQNEIVKTRSDNKKDLQKYIQSK